MKLFDDNLNRQPTEYPDLYTMAYDMRILQLWMILLLSISACQNHLYA